MIAQKMGVRPVVPFVYFRAPQMYASKYVSPTNTAAEKTRVTAHQGESANNGPLNINNCRRNKVQEKLHKQLKTNALTLFFYHVPRACTKLIDVVLLPTA